MSGGVPLACPGPPNAHDGWSEEREGQPASDTSNGGAVGLIPFYWLQGCIVGARGVICPTPRIWQIHLYCYNSDGFAPPISHFAPPPLIQFLAFRRHAFKTSWNTGVSSVCWIKILWRNEISYLNWQWGPPQPAGYCLHKGSNGLISGGISEWRYIVKTFWHVM